jgi:ketosteroid isomerase-like protein
MKHLLFCGLLLLSSGLVAPAQTKNVSSQTGEAEIRTWLDQFIKVFTQKNVDEIMALYADDVVAYDIVPPLQYVGKQAYRKDYETFLAQYQGNLRVGVKDLHVGAVGDLGYATGLELIGGTLANGQKSEVWLRFTSLFRRVNGKWLDFHDHVSVPTDMESGKAMLELKP